MSNLLKRAFGGSRAAATFQGSKQYTGIDPSKGGSNKTSDRAANQRGRRVAPVHTLGPIKTALSAR